MFDKRYILIIDSILIVGALVCAFLLIGYSRPLVIGQLNSESSSLLFELPNIEYILIDTNSAFDSPQTIFINEQFDLKEGRYFVKFFHGTNSEIRELKFDLDVRLEFKKINDSKFGLFNIGSDDLKIDTYNTGSLVDSSFAYSGGLDE